MVDKGRRASASRTNLVFTSAGDRASLSRWLRGRRNFDLWVTYYGDTPGRFRDVAEIYQQRKGAKFQNLLYAYQTQKPRLERYDAIMVMDDDVEITGTQISRLFDIRRQYDLWLLQPAFGPHGKISWDVTRADPRYRLRFTNFVEVTCPLFRRDRLDHFMELYDPMLVGYGIDWWFLDALGPSLEGRVAIVDEIACVNPSDSTKGGRREIDRLQSAAEREAAWQQVKDRQGIRTDELGIRQFGAVPRSALRRLAHRARALWPWRRDAFDSPYGR